jgi:hypothetical protein
MNKLKVAKHMPILEKLARSRSFLEKLLETQKVAKKLPSTICLRLMTQSNHNYRNYSNKRRGVY